MYYISIRIPYNTRNMRFLLVIVIYIVVILGMGVKARLRVHDEYKRRQSAYGQSVSFNIRREPPAGVHSEYRRRWLRGPTKSVNKHHKLPMWRYTRHHTLHS